MPSARQISSSGVNCRPGSDSSYQSSRRSLLIALGACLLCPYPASSQGKVPRIAFLDPGTRESGLYGPFLAGMKELGYIEGKNIAIQPRFANGDLERLPALAKELADW